MTEEIKKDERLEKAVLRASQLLQGGAFKDAVAWCEKVLAIYPDEPRITEAMKKAQSAMQENLERDILDYAGRLENEGDYDMAIAQLAKLLEINPEHKIAKERIAYLEALKKEETGIKSKLPDPDELLKSIDSDLTDKPATPTAGRPPAKEIKAETAFGIDADDPFALGEQAPKPRIEGLAGAGGGKEKKKVEVVDDISSMLLTSEKMHEATEFATHTVDVPSEVEGLELEAPADEHKETEQGAEIESDISSFMETSGGRDAEPASSQKDSFEIPDAVPQETVIEEEPTKEGKLTAEEKKHIQELLNKGQMYYERGQCEQAIDTWYQVLVIDENHRKALQLIEKAKQELVVQGKSVHVDVASEVLESSDSAMAQASLAEGAKEAIQTLLAEAQQFISVGNYDGAIARCERIVELDPTNQDANRLMNEANRKRKAEERRRLEQEQKAAGQAVPTEYVPASKPQVAFAKKPPATKATLLLIGGMGLLVAVGVALAVFFMFFGKPAPPPPEPPKVATPQPQAQKAPEPPPQQETKAPVAQTNEEEIRAQKREKAVALLKESQKFFAVRKYAESAQAIAESLALDPANFEAVDFKEKVEAGLSAYEEEHKRYRSATESFKSGNYEEALRNLYRMTEARYYSAETQSAIQKGWYSLMTNPKEIETYIQNSWYNMGVSMLKIGNIEQSIKSFEEYLRLRPDDADAKRHMEVAQRYKLRAKDENYTQYVQFLKLRE